MKSGRVRLVLEIDDEGIEACKKRYFAMVTALAKHAGYVSHKEREQFKEEIKAHLGGESISAMTTKEQVLIKIEEVHQFAAEHYSYKFPSNDPDIVQFNNKRN